jgi:hypothetical protein
VVTVLAAATMFGIAPAQADPNGVDKTPGHATGTATDGSVSAAIEKFGQSICPSLVKPGSSVASTLSELQGNTGLTPTLTGMVAGFVIQTQCPAVMTKLASGDLSALQLLGPQPAAQRPPGLDLSALMKPPGR